MFSIATLDVSKLVALYIPAWTDDDEETPFYYVVGVHDIYDTPIGMKKPGGEESVSSRITRNQQHVILFTREELTNAPTATDENGLDIPITVIQTSGNLAMVLLRILHVRGAASANMIHEFGKSTGRWASLEAMTEFQHRCTIGPVKDVEKKCSVTINVDQVPAKEVDYSWLQNDDAEPFEIAHAMIKYHDHLPKSEELSVLYKSQFAIFSKSDLNLSEEQSERLRQAWDSVKFLLKWLPSKTSHLVSSAKTNFWVSSRNLTVQPPEKDVGFGDAFRRATRSMNGAGALLATNVVYFSAYRDHVGRATLVTKDDAQNTRFIVDFSDSAQQPAVEAFWSANVYHGATLKQLDNKYGVWAVNSDWVKHTDSEATNNSFIVLSIEPPTLDFPRNWIPILADEPFNLVLRCYGPKMSPDWMPPPLKRQVCVHDEWQDLPTTSFPLRLFNLLFK